MGAIREAAPYGLLLLVCSTQLQNYPVGSSVAGGVWNFVIFCEFGGAV